MQTVLKIDGVIPSFASEGYDTPVMMSSLCDVSLTSQNLTGQFLACSGYREYCLLCVFT